MLKLLPHETVLLLPVDLRDLLLRAEQRLRSWARESEGFSELLSRVFGELSSQKSSELQECLLNGGLNLQVELLDGQVLGAIRGAYTSADPSGEERIYLNADWLRTATPEAIEALLLEEIGHAIDVRLNGTVDTPGDEGAIFSAFIRGVELPIAETSQNDHHTILINGQMIAVEAAAPTLSTGASPALTTITEDAGAPSGSVGTLVSALIDSGGSHNNFSDADGDSPAIAIVGTNLAGGTLYFSTNNGSNWSDVGAVSTASARVLYADSNTRLAFVPAAHFNGTINDLITFKAWDRTGAESISSSPTLTGTYDTTGSALGVTLSADGNTAFVADGNEIV